MSKLILVRHGQSMWNLEDKFTGWVDVPLSPKGKEESISAGKKIDGTRIDVVYVSHLMRAKDTLFLMISQWHHEKRIPIIYHPEDKRISKWEKNSSDKSLELPIFESVELAERYYGKLQGQNKAESARKFGAEQVRIWRRSFDVRPPGGESLKDTAERTLPYFKKYIVKDLKLGKNVLVVAHGNSLRSIAMYIEGMSREEILNFELKTGISLIYTFDDKMKLESKELLG